MKFARFSSRSRPSLSFTLAASALLTTAAAQKNGPPPAAAGPGAPQAAAPAAPTVAATSAGDSDSSNTDSDSDTSTESPTATNTDGSAETGFPTLTSSDDFPTLTGFPTLSSTSTSTSSSTSFNYPPPTVPPTANAPYMQKSNLPEGTVFIAVGAGLAAIGLIMIVWRLAVTWWVNRSAQRIALSSYPQDSKALHARKHSAFYSQQSDSTLSLEKLSKEGRPKSAPGKGQTPNPSLFFSPTAGAGMHSINKRPSSGYLPAGYYSTSNVSAASGLTTSQLGAVGAKRPVSAHQGDVPPVPPPHDSSRIPHGRGQTGGAPPSQLLDDLMSVPPLPPPSNDSQRNVRRR